MRWTFPYHGRPARARWEKATGETPVIRGLLRALRVSVEKYLRRKTRFRRISLKRVPMYYARLALITIAFLSAICIAADLNPKTYPSEVPIINGFNDPNAIRYDAAHEAELERMENEWELSDGDEKEGYYVTVNIGDADNRVEKDIRVHKRLRLAALIRKMES